MMKKFREPINLGVKSSRHGKSTMMIKCPFCERELRYIFGASLVLGKDVSAERYSECMVV